MCTIIIKLTQNWNWGRIEQCGKFLGRSSNKIEARGCLDLLKSRLFQPHSPKCFNLEPNSQLATEWIKTCPALCCICLFLEFNCLFVYQIFLSIEFFVSSLFVCCIRMFVCLFVSMSYCMSKRGLCKGLLYMYYLRISDLLFIMQNPLSKLYNYVNFSTFDSQGWPHDARVTCRGVAN